MALLLLAACGTVAPVPLAIHIDSDFRDFAPPDKAKIKGTPFRRTFLYPQREVWDATLTLIAQHAVDLRTYRGQDTIFYFEFDGTLVEKTFRNNAFPFALLIEEKSGATEVYVHPMMELAGDIPKKKREALKRASDQKSDELLERLAVQLERSRRWPWLKGS
jgi:hypothetical protein